MAFNWKSMLAGAVGSGISSQFSALKPFQAAIGAGAGALASPKNRLQGAVMGSVGGGVGSTLAGGARGLFSGGTGGTMQNFGSGAMEGLKSFGGSIPGMGGVGTSNPTGALAKFFSPAAAGAAGAAAGGGGSVFDARSGLQNAVARSVGGGARLPSSGTPGSSFMQGGSPSVSGSMNAMDMFKKMIPGAAVGFLGSAMAPEVDAPDYSGVKNDLMNRIQTGGNPEARAAAMKEYMSTLSAPTGASAEAGMANAKLISDRQKEESLKGIQQQFAANNGNTMGNSAYDDAVMKSNRAYDQNYAAQAAQLQFEYDNQQKVQKLAAAKALEGMDDTQLQYYAGLAGLDIMSIQEKTGMDVASANAIKGIAQTAAELMMQKSLGLGGVKA